jgi:hypothetical protein
VKTASKRLHCCACAFAALGACRGEYTLGDLPSAGALVDGGPGSSVLEGGIDAAPSLRCAGKSCGDPCGPCNNVVGACTEAGAAATGSVFMVCDSLGGCTAVAPACGSPGTPSPFAPCAGKVCGATCTCVSNQPTCTGQCAADGACVSDGGTGC